MSYLYSQLWLCILSAGLLGAVLGWFFRGSNKKKISEIEKRWRERFSELEINNQSLLSKLKQNEKFTSQHEHLVKRIGKMEKAAKLSREELQTRQFSIDTLHEELQQTQSKLLEKDTQLDELTSQLATLESEGPGYKTTSTAKNHAAETSFDKIHQALEKELANANKQIEELDAENKQVEEENAEMQLLMNEYASQCRQLEVRRQELEKLADSYKAHLIDAESKLQVAYESVHKRRTTTNRKR